jgi:ABC-type bacteriocin/lantibiotic exporter with double-glycine peptidase domain
MELPIQPICQGRTNGCGTASLAMALNYLAGNPTAPITQAMLDRGHREMDSFCAPHMLIRAARKHGFQGQLYNRTTLAEIMAHLDAQHPLLSLHSTNGTLTGLHYVLVAGYQKSETGTDTQLILWDPAPSHGQRKVIDYQQFVKRFWQPFTVFGIPTGLERTMIALSRTSNLPPTRDTPWSLHVAYQLNRLLNTLSTMLAALQKTRRRITPPDGLGLQ